MRSLIDILDLSIEEIEALMQTASDIIAHPDRYAEACRGKKLATLFFEPSTRTRLSFEAAMLELGGNVIGFSEASSTSASKGESMADREAAAWIDAVVNDKTPVTRPEQAFTVTRILEGIYESAKSGKPYYFD